MYAVFVPKDRPNIIYVTIVKYCVECGCVSCSDSFTSRGLIQPLAHNFLCKHM